MPERTTFPELTTVQCPECDHQVVLGYFGELVPFHWLILGRGRKTPCSGQGAVVRVSAAGLVAVQPEPAGEVSG